MDYIRRIRDLREDHDLTQIKVGKALNLSQRGYSHLENGNIDISSEKLITLSKLYNVSTDYILGLSDDPSPYNKITKNNSK